MMCTLEQRGRVFVVTLTGDSENRLGHPLIASIRSALTSVAVSALSNGAGPALVTVAEGRFFSNGLDIGLVGTSRARLGELIDTLRAIAADLLALPMPTVAASEIDIGWPLPPYFMALLRAKITAGQAFRDVVLQGKKLRALEAKEMGIVDAVCPGAPETAVDALKLAKQLAARKWDGTVYSSIRISMFLDACRSVGIFVENDEEKARYFASRL
ncbi:unnamed protein product [Alopecurus aequalis]